MRSRHHLLVTVDELRWFLVLADTQNATRAAALLNITQPTLSRALRRIERQVGALLFDRSRQRLHLNAQGEVFRLHARRALEEISTAGDAIAAMLGPAPGSIRLSFLHSFGTWLVPDLMRDFGAANPDVRFLLHQDSADAVITAIRDDRADIAITSPRPRDPLIGWMPLLDEPLVLVLPLLHPMAQRPSLRLVDVAGEAFVAMQPAFGLRQTTDAMFHRRGITQSVKLESAEIATIRALVATGLGIAIVPGGPHTPRSADLAVVPLTDDDAFRSVGLVWHADRELSHAVRRFRSYVSGRAHEQTTARQQAPGAPGETA
jgi:DNA-binding transcriptional LysR family regulator